MIPPLAMSIIYYNNWSQFDEFIFLSFEMKIDDGMFFFTAGLCGVGFVFSASIQ